MEIIHIKVDLCPFSDEFYISFALVHYTATILSQNGRFSETSRSNRTIAAILNRAMRRIIIIKGT